MKAWLLGMLLGDGTSYADRKNKRYMVWVDQHIKNLSLITKLTEAFKLLGFNPIVYDVPG